MLSTLLAHILPGRMRIWKITAIHSNHGQINAESIRKRNFSLEYENIVFRYYLRLKETILVLQNHSMFGVGRDLYGSYSPAPLPKQGLLQQAAQDLVQAGLEYLQRGILHNLPGQPVQVLHHPQREEDYT